MGTLTRYEIPAALPAFVEIEGGAYQPRESNIGSVALSWVEGKRPANRRSIIAAGCEGRRSRWCAPGSSPNCRGGRQRCCAPCEAEEIVLATVHRRLRSQQAALSAIHARQG
jgi:hypothetical protein